MGRLHGTLTGLAAALLAVAATAATAPPADPAPQDPHPGQAIFQGKGSCFTCHGQTAAGTPLAPDLTDDAWVNFETRPSLKELGALVKAGVARPVQHPAPMPPMGGARLSDREVEQVAEYVLLLSEAADTSATAPD